MTKNAFDIVRDFEQAVAEYTGAPYCVAVNSCTNALFLCLRYHRIDRAKNNIEWLSIPKHTYLSVPMQIRHAAFDPDDYEIRFRDEKWEGEYRIEPYEIYDSARRFTSGMFDPLFGRKSKYQYKCVSFHWSKILGIQQGGAILHNNPEFDTWARKARFDGRTEGVTPKDDNIDMLGWHMYLSPEIAAEGLVRLMHLPKNNPDLPNDDYPDLSKMEVFK